MKFENVYRIGLGAESAVGLARTKGRGVLVGRTAWSRAVPGYFRVLAEVAVDFDYGADSVCAEVRVPRSEGGSCLLAKERLGACACSDAYFAAAIATMLAYASGAELETAVYQSESALSP